MKITVQDGSRCVDDEWYQEKKVDLEHNLYKASIELVDWCGVEAFNKAVNAIRRRQFDEAVRSRQGWKQG